MACQRNKKSDVPPTDLTWLEQLANEINLPFAPEGWYTVAQIEQKLGRNRQFIERLLESKGAQKQHFMARRSGGNRVKMIHYKL